MNHPQPNSIVNKMPLQDKRIGNLSYDDEGEPIHYERWTLTYDQENKLWDDIVAKIKEELNKPV